MGAQPEIESSSLGSLQRLVRKSLLQPNWERPYIVKVCCYFPFPFLFECFEYFCELDECILVHSSEYCVYHSLNSLNDFYLLRNLNKNI